MDKLEITWLVLQFFLIVFFTYKIGGLMQEKKTCKAVELWLDWRAEALSKVTTQEEKIAVIIESEDRLFYDVIDSIE